MKLLLLALLLVTTVMISSCTPAFAADNSSKPPDTIFLNGDIYTQGTPARAQAIAVSAGKIVAVGSTDAIV